MRNSVNILIININFSVQKLKNYIEYFIKYNPSVYVKLLSLNKLNFSNNSKMEMYYSKTDNSFPKEIIDFEYSEVYILDKKMTPLLDDILFEIFNKKLNRIFYVNEIFKKELFQPYKNKTSKNLLVFPGPMVPLFLGSHQRAFNMINYLNKMGCYTDVLVTAGNPTDNKRVEKILQAICPNVYVYKNTKRKFPFFILWRKRVEWFIRKKILAYQEIPNDLFSERDFIKPTFSAQKTLKHIFIHNTYKNIIISYAWMINTISLLPKDKTYNLICDTHDVQYIRNATMNQDTRRFFLFKQKEKELELKQLNKMDYVLAISNADYSAFAQEINHDKLLLVQPGFDYALQKIKKRHRESLVFGFIGGAMEANVKSLIYILNIWWPVIKKLNPNHKLYIAGAICNNETIKKVIFLEKNITLLGFVNSLKTFYNDIDVALNPVIVKGGLNFKSLEPIFAGKHLITNSFGLDCIDKSNFIKSYDDILELETYLKKIFYDINFDFEERKKNQQFIKNIFSNDVVYKNLLDILK